MFNSILQAYNFTMISIPGTTSAVPANLCILPTIRSPRRKRELAEKAEPKTYNRRKLCYIEIYSIKLLPLVFHLNKLVCCA